MAGIASLSSRARTLTLGGRRCSRESGASRSIRGQGRRVVSGVFPKVRAQQAPFTGALFLENEVSRRKKTVGWDEPARGQTGRHAEERVHRGVDGERTKARQATGGHLKIGEQPGGAGRGAAR